MMTAAKKIKSLFYIIAFLFITNVILLVFFLTNSREVKSPAGNNTSLVGSFLKTDLHFDERQMAEYQKLRKAHFEEANPLFEEISKAKNKFYENIYVDSLPDSVITISASPIGKKQMALDKHMLQYFKSVRSLCTPEQLRQFDSLFRNVIEKITARRLNKNTSHNH